MFTFSAAISFFAKCETQKEVDGYWTRLFAGGQTLQWGWLKDKFGVSWQVVPTILGTLLQDQDPAKSRRVMEAMMKMDKSDIERLEEAYAQR